MFMSKQERQLSAWGKFAKAPQCPKWIREGGLLVIVCNLVTVLLLRGGSMVIFFFVSKIILLCHRRAAGCVLHLNGGPL